MTDIYGQDIALDEYLQPKVAANGELLLTKGAETGVQDIILGLDIYLGALFYDGGFGSLLVEWVKEENTEGNRLGLEIEVKQRIQMDPRVAVGSTSCSVLQWDEVTLMAQAQWTFIDEDHPRNLVISYDQSKKEMVIKDVNPTVI
jgi:hypothetical protein